MGGKNGLEISSFFLISCGKIKLYLSDPSSLLFFYLSFSFSSKSSFVAHLISCLFSMELRLANFPGKPQKGVTENMGTAFLSL